MIPGGTRTIGNSFMDASFLDEMDFWSSLQQGTMLDFSAVTYVLSAYVPAAQSEHDEAPAAEEYFPAAQFEHDEVLAAEEYFPAPQFVHDEAPADEYFPAPQFVHDEAPAEEYFPAAQLLQPLQESQL